MYRRLLLFIALFSFVALYAESYFYQPRVYMLRLDDEIGSETWHYTRRALEEASAHDAEMILVHLNTYGGSVVHADSIRTSLMRCQLPVVAFVDNNAASAGALIALACDTVYMRPGSTMGAVTVVNGSDGQAMPDKYQSYMRAMMRATAERHGHIVPGDSTSPWRRDPLIAEAMVDPRVQVPGLIDSTRVLTFTADEALKWGYADGKASSVAEVLDDMGVDNYVIEEFHPTWQDRLIGFLTNPAVQAVLIMIILGGIYMEMHTPGVGFPSAAAIIAAVLYFLPLYIAGISSSWIVLLFALGVILIVLEIFVVPGFGLTGISGIACMCVALLLGLIEGYSFSLGMATLGTLLRSLGIFIAGCLLAVVAVWYLTSRYGPRWIRRHTDLTTELRVEHGFVGVDMSPARLIGHEGAAITDMRPSGKVEIDGEVYDAVATIGYIYAGSRVIVTRYENAQIYVRTV